MFKPAESPAGPAQRFLTVAAISSWCPRLLSAGCTDGMVGVAARVASAQVPWHTVEESPGWDFTNHIAALEVMLAEMQLRVRKNQSGACVCSLVCIPSDLWFVCRSLFRSGPCRRPSQPGPRLAANTKTQRTPWRT